MEQHICADADGMTQCRGAGNSTAWVVGALLVVGAALGACGSSTASNPTTTVVAHTASPSTTSLASTTTTAAPSVGPQVLGILNNLDSQVNADASGPNYSALTTAFGNAAQQLQAITFPAADQADAKTLIRDLNKLSADATEQDAAQLQSDLETAHADDDTLRGDLQLAPAPTS